MKGVHKKKWFWPLVIFSAVALGFALIMSNRKIDGTKGGILEGASHRNGGIKGRLKSTGETIIMEGNENILTAKVNEIKGEYFCEGTLGGISSAVNEEAGGVEFNRNGRCFIKN